MSISERTRKLLWMKTGSRCAFCKTILAIDKSKTDDASIVGDECHIRSGSKLGPRFDPLYPSREIDEYDNLIILCKIHHKMIDDQPETFTSKILEDLKTNHEKWVENRLSQIESNPLPRVRRIGENIPASIRMISNSQELFNMLDNCEASTHSFPSDLNEEEVEMVGGFLQLLSDYADISGDLQPIEKVRAVSDLSREINNLQSCNFFVFAGIERQILEGGNSPPTDWKLLHVSIARKNDSRIISTSHAT